MTHLYPLDTLPCKSRPIKPFEFHIWVNISRDVHKLLHLSSQKLDKTLIISRKTRKEPLYWTHPRARLQNKYSIGSDSKACLSPNSELSYFPLRYPKTPNSRSNQKTPNNSTTIPTSYLGTNNLSWLTKQLTYWRPIQTQSSLIFCMK